MKIRLLALSFSLSCMIANAQIPIADLPPDIPVSVLQEMYPEYGCLNLYNDYSYCMGNSYLTYSKNCQIAIEKWQANPSCVSFMCAQNEGQNLAFNSCGIGINQARYQMCMNQGMGKNQYHQTEAQWCQRWAGPAGQQE